MKKLARVSAITVVALTGCASTSNLEMLAERVGTLENKVSDISKRMINAEIAANRAVNYAQETNSKLDNMFRKSMMK